MVTNNIDSIILERFTPIPGICNHSSTVYYYQGNFFQPGHLVGLDVNRIKGKLKSDVIKMRMAIKKFSQENHDLIERDRAKPDWRPVYEMVES